MINELNSISNKKKEFLKSENIKISDEYNFDLAKKTIQNKNILEKKKIIDNMEDIPPNLNELNKIGTSKNLKNFLLYDNCKLEDIGINFTLPGYDINLKKNGSEINLDIDNLEEFINLIFKKICFEGISESIIAFKKGFNLVFPIKSLRCFHSFEISELICGANFEVWNEKILYDCVLPNYGYDKNR